MKSPALEINRTALGDIRLVDDAAEPLGERQVRLRIDRFAITANNITYAVFGDALAYWSFFPTELPWGRVPAMGWAEVIESSQPDIEVGSRYYGWYPMAAQATIEAMPTADGFRDDGPHRQPHAPIYRAYTDTRHDALYDTADDGEDRHALLRGLFLTGFLAEEFFADPGDDRPPYFGAQQVIVLSASSKTAIGFAQRAQARGTAAVIGITSGRNTEFVDSLGFYDRVLTYDTLDDITDATTVSIDMAGDPAVLSAIHHRLGDRLAYSMTVGRSHHDAPTPSREPMPGPTPTMFFAPAEVSRRRQQWGAEEFGRLAADALARFVDGSRTWLRVEHRAGPEAVAAAWLDVYHGSIPPDVGIVATLDG